VSPIIKFTSEKNKIFVTSDLPVKREITREAEKAPIAEVNRSDRFTIYYETTQWYISDVLEKQIQYVVRELNRNPNYKLELSSHTDCQGDSKVNLVLSRQRLAEAIKLFFSRGANESQIIGRYFGEEKPVNNCHCDGANNYDCSNEDLKKNRRTEVRLIK
jgi:outer membrane protein OmpA-like peptidoglycan-associated protein